MRGRWKIISQPATRRLGSPMTPAIRSQIGGRIAAGEADMWDAAVLWQHVEALETELSLIRAGLDRERMNAVNIAAQTFPPGAFIEEEIGARGVSTAEFARWIGLPVEEAEELIGGRVAVTPELAERLGRVFETSTQLWLNLEDAYRRYQSPDEGAPR